MTVYVLTLKFVSERDRDEAMEALDEAAMEGDIAEAFETICTEESK